MRIVGIQKEAQGAEIGQKETAAINAAINFLKGKLPEIVPMLTNPTTRSFLTKFFDLIASDPAVLNGFKNAMQTISTGMQSDAAGTTTAVSSASMRM